MRLFRRDQPADAPEHLKTGRWGEQIAADYLEQKGYRITGRRVRIGTRDELDLVAQSNGVLVFVEVKTRKRETFGRPIAAVDRAKRRTQSRAAVRYLQRLKNPKPCFRFDVVEVIGAPSLGVPPLVRHLENAFPLDRRYMLP